MTAYADSSFLVSCYALDANTFAAKTHLAALAQSLPFTALHALEVRNAFKLGIFRGTLTKQAAQAAWRNVELDLRAGRLVRTTVRWATAFRVAGALVDRHTEREGTRSLDVLHVAAAKVFRVADFLSFDQRQRSLATQATLHVIS